MKKSKIFALIGIVGAIIGIFVLIFISARPYITVSQVLANPSKYYNQEIQVIGIVRDYSGGNFNLTEGDDYLYVDTTEVVIPSGLNNSMEVVVTGIFNSSLILKASQILTQCS
ncbi:MAG: cytochrome c maturation protein CcmE [Candidatus Helarchaeota archaeon]|nr:cytochrome c maturation protein CcmE [Candidatus Helarchaeota archaeon]